MINTSKYSGQNLFVFGLGKAGASAVRALSGGGANVVAWDENSASVEKLQSENLANVQYQNFTDCDFNEFDALVLSPGVPLTHPEPHKIVLWAKAANCPIICDIEVLYNCKENVKFIGITGTNGKSTTTALTAHILKESGVESDVGGNIGFPALELKDLSDDGVYVIEMSSYQLDLIEKMRFTVSVLLNITPDHIDRHGDLQGYINAKKHIYDNQSDGDFAVVSFDDEHVKKIYDELRNEGKISNIIAISVNEKLENGISIVDGVLVDNFFGNLEIKLPEFKKLAGKHNSQNIAAAYASCRSLGLNAEDIINHVATFEGLAHRMQLVCEKDGIKFVNDSKATNAEAAEKALLTYDNIYWILGGVAKNGGIDSLKQYFPRITKAYLIGKAQDEFDKTLDGSVEYEKCQTIENATKCAVRDSKGKAGAVVLLSPACASFDQFPNFEERGKAFCDAIEICDS